MQKKLAKMKTERCEVVAKSAENRKGKGAADFWWLVWLTLTRRGTLTEDSLLALGKMSGSFSDILI